MGQIAGNGVGRQSSSEERVLVVFSHLRWDWVWQRPQQLVSRLAEEFTRTIFVEEPVSTDRVDRPVVRVEQRGPVERLWLEVPGPDERCGFEDPRSAPLGDLLASRIGSCADVTAWLYCPLALPHAVAIGPTMIAYDVMDDLAAFAQAPRNMRERQRELLSRADVVFTGGRSLQRSVVSVRPDATCCPSGVDAEHYRPALAVRAARARRPPVAGYVGVLDERLDLELLRDLARELPDWRIEMVGPVAKIDPRSLPAEPNIAYLGARSYQELPAIMGGFDVALMPFALNEATRSISPTKSLEYLAAGLPIVSTRIADVVSDVGHLVDLADDGQEFALACRRQLDTDPQLRLQAAKPLLRWNHWDAIAARMHAALVDFDTIDLEAAT